MEIFFLLIAVALGVMGWIPSKVYFDSLVNEAMGIFFCLSFLTHSARKGSQNYFLVACLFFALLFSSFFLSFSLFWVLVVLTCFYVWLFLTNIKDAWAQVPWHVAILIFSGLTIAAFFLKTNQ